MTDVRLSITLDAEQARRAAQDFRAGFKALTRDLSQPLGDAAALNQVRAGALAATGATLGLSGAYGQQQAHLAGLSTQQTQTAASTRQLTADQRQLASAAAQSTQTLARQARTAGAAAAMSGGLGASLRSALGGAIGTYAGVQTVATLAATADAYSLMVARLKVATASQEEFNTAQQELQRIATANAAPVASLVGLYGRLSTPLKEAGRTQSEILQVVEAVSASFRVSGASAQETEGAILQFAQALGSGALRGDEFNSVAEQAPRLMHALAAGLGVASSSLKSMAADGELTASVVTDALLSQLDTLRAEAERMPDTVGGAMTTMVDKWNAAIGQADMQPLIEAINGLGNSLTDPAVVAGLANLASALTRLSGEVVSGASEVGDLGQRLGFLAAHAVGGVSELDKLDQAIRDTRRSLNGTGLSTTLDGLFYSKDELKARLAALEAARKLIIDQQTGMNDELHRQQVAAAAAAEALARQKRQALEAHAGELRAVRDTLVKDAEQALKAERKAESDALRDLERIKQDRIRLEQTFKASIASTRTGGAQEPSYDQAWKLRLAARGSLDTGDTEAAIEQSLAALRVLEQLEEQGANTQGFESFKVALRDIALAAKDLEQTQAQDALTEIGSKIEALETLTAGLEKTEITPTLSDAAVAAVTAQLQALAERLGQTLTIPVRMVPTTSDAQGAPAVPNTPPAPAPLKRATGGWIDGPGTPTSDSILLAASRGEYVLNARAATALGAANLDFMNRSGQLPVRDHLIPQIPTLPSLERRGERQPLNLAMPWGGSYALEGSPAEVARLQDDLRRTARKFGRTRP